jgi:hypothetical protein
MLEMDADNNNVISFDEFKATIHSYLLTGHHKNDGLILLHKEKRNQIPEDQVEQQVQNFES